MFNYLFFKTRIVLVYILLKNLSLSKWFNLLNNLLSYLFKQAKSGKTPSVLTLVLTYKCNYSCIMCQKSSLDPNIYNSGIEEMPFQKIEKLLRENAKHLSVVRLHGGEPLMHSKFPQIIDLLDELKLKYTLITNGSLLTKEISEKLLKNCLLITVSIDSAESRMYSKMRVGGNLKLVSKNIIELNQIKKRTPLLNLAATLFTFNIPHLKELVEYSSIYGFQSITLSEGAYYNTPNIKPDHFIKNNPSLIRHNIDLAQNTADELGIVLRYNSEILYWNKQENQLIKNRNRLTSCFNYYFSLIISPQMKVQICALSDYLGDLNKHSFSEIWNNNNLAIYKGRNIINKENVFPKSCRYCNDYNSSLSRHSDKEYSYTNLQHETKYWVTSGKAIDKNKHV